MNNTQRWKENSEMITIQDLEFSLMVYYLSRNISLIVYKFTIRNLSYDSSKNLTMIHFLFKGEKKDGREKQCL